ncbi:MAG: aspartate aminotransferase family protein [Rhodospirillaceae bacterium TMED8]|nr:aspartate aminotransferase family protein [Magnetovibrio sp.]OUT53342.1 MAG: aspartate aminotransferase family protein [Rhodospirillaceae bacterium TMED8]|tara:strand:- start:6112 stop:7497 length:1386 start_codon:yes stop_codon:yes gene_type:complete
MNFAPNSAEARDIAYHLHGQTNIKVHEEQGPMIIERGNGVRVYDEAGAEYIEGLAGLWSVSLGFNEPRLVEAAKRQMEKLPYYHTFAHKASSPAIDLAEKLISLAPVRMSKVIFQNSGSEAVDTAVKFVWYYHNAIGKPDKKKIIARKNAYHGSGIASASLTGLERMHQAFDLPITDRVLRADCPHFYKCGLDGETEEEFATRCAANLEKLIQDEGAENVAAFIAEPIMGAGGVIVPAVTYFEKIQVVLKKYDILLIADEVICGFGRTGNMWGSQTFNLKPDMITSAKALSSSYLPISALFINEKIYQAFRKKSSEAGVFGHGYTYAGHPVSAAVALETLKIYEERDIVGHVRRIAPVLQTGLRQFLDHDLVGEVRGVGLISGVELMANRDQAVSFKASDQVGPTTQTLAQKHGLIIRAMGDTIAFCPPLVINEDDICELLQRFGKTLDAVRDWAHRQSLI